MGNLDEGRELTAAADARDVALTGQDVLALQRAVHAVIRALEVEAAALGLSPAELNTLACMRAGESARVRDLLERTAQRPSTLTGVLNRLEGRGLARRELDRLDRRSLRVELTASGRAAHVEVLAAYERIADRSGMSLGRRTARAGFRRVLHVLEQTSLQRLEAGAD